MDCSPPGSPFHGVLQARILEWVAISFSRWSSQPKDWTQVSHIAGRHFTIWATRKAPIILWIYIKLNLHVYHCAQIVLLRVTNSNWDVGLWLILFSFLYFPVVSKFSKIIMYSKHERQSTLLFKSKKVVASHHFCGRNINQLLWI